MNDHQPGPMQSPPENALAQSVIHAPHPECITPGTDGTGARCRTQNTASALPSIPPPSDSLKDTCLRTSNSSRTVPPRCFPASPLIIHTVLNFVAL